MVRLESECVGPCPQGCAGRGCPYYSVLNLYCDKCGSSAEKLYSGNDKYEQLCDECAEEEMKAALEDCDFDELCDYFGYSEVTSYE